MWNATACHVKILNNIEPENSSLLLTLLVNICADLQRCTLFKMAGWNNLPVELREIIIGDIRQTLPPCTSCAPTPERQSFSLPLVCREWQWYFSHVNFGVVFLDQHRLDDFRRYVSENKPRRKHVRLVVLRVKLPEYDCDSCHTDEDDATSRGNDIILRDALQKFMRIMSDWGVSDGLPKGDIELDLGAYSPSDRKHDVRHSQRIPGERCSRPKPEPACCARHDPLLGLKRRLGAPLGDHHAQHFSSIWTGARFASARVLGSLVIRRQTYRHLSSKILRRLFAQSLPNLAHLRHESWAHPDLGARIARRTDTLGTILNLPPTLTSLNLYCDSNALFQNGIEAFPQGTDWMHGSHLAEAATGLETLTACFGFEGSSFLTRSSSGQLQYPVLRKLVLTSRFLSRERLEFSVVPAMSLLLAAATSAHRHMPSLEFMDVWFAEDGDAFLVRLVRGSEPGTLLVRWFSTWHDEGDAMVPLFGVLGSMWRAREVQPQNQLVCERAPFTKVDGDGWHPTGYEELAACILHPESRREIREEFGFHEDEGD